MNPPEKTVAGKNMTKSVHEMSASARQVETVDGTGVPAVPNVLGTPDSRFSGRERSVDPANAGKQVRPAGSCGYLHVYTGDGKGKTTAALGLALRATGYGLDVLMLQFAKKLHCAEHDAAPRLGLRIVQAILRTRIGGAPNSSLPWR